MSQKTKIKFINKDKSLFFPTLKKRVETYFNENNLSRHADSTMIVKTLILVSAYVFPFILLLAFQPTFWVSMLLWFIMGVGVAGIGMSVMHDANHGAYSKNSTVNFLMGFLCLSVAQTKRRLFVS